MAEKGRDRARSYSFDSGRGKEGSERIPDLLARSGSAGRNRGAEIPFTRDLKALYKLRTRTLSLKMRKVSHKDVKRRGKGHRTTRSL